MPDEAPVIQTTWFEPGQSYRLMAADSPEGPFEPALSGIAVDHHQLATIELASAMRAVYRLEAE